MSWSRKAVAAMAGAALVFGLAAPAWSQQGTRRERESPAAVEPPVLPEGTFDHDRELAELAAARAANQAGNPAEARRQAEAAAGHWPGDPATWSELQSACQALKDDACRQRAAFFLAKVEYVNALPPHIAVLGFQNIAEQPVGTRTNNFTYDQGTVDTARHLWAFYNTIDPMVAQRDAGPEPSFVDKYPLAPMALTIGVVAGILTTAKSMANK